jgi:hypothetical protein
MTTAAAPSTVDRSDVRTMVSAGVKLGVLTCLAVVAYALLSRVMTGTIAVVVQSAIVLAGGALAAFLPAMWIRPRSVDGISWAALVAVEGATVYAIIDTAVLRPFHLYSWKWDAIGGGSGWWYIPIWWMGSAILAWLGAWVVSNAARSRPDVSVWGAAIQTLVLGLVLFAVLAVTGVAPFHPATAALGFSIALVLLVPISAVLNRK